MIETQTKKDKVLIIGAQTKDYTDEKFEILMDEMKELTLTAGGDIAGVVTQKVNQLNNKSAIGSGKVSEVKDLVNQDEIDLVIFLNELTPSMTSYLEEEFNCRVIDRIQLILDIFALRAKSKEGKLQVELAQYEYLLPRLTGKGASMSRLAGGIGTRGPGETKLEMDRRHIRNRISEVKKELKKVSAHRQRARHKRQTGTVFTIGLIGYTNAGKSTLLNQLTEAETYVQDQLFATLDPLTRKMTINGHEQFTVTDTVGFIEELPTQLIQAFKSTLEEMRYVDLLLHVVDASSSARLLHEETVLGLLEELEMKEIPVLTVYNKKDKIQDEFTPSLHPNILISAYNESDIDRLKDKIWDLIIEQAEKYRLIIDPVDSSKLADLRQNTLVERLVFDENEEKYIIEGYRQTY